MKKFTYCLLLCFFVNTVFSQSSFSVCGVFTIEGVNRPYGAYICFYRIAEPNNISLGSTTINQQDGSYCFTITNNSPGDEYYIAADWLGSGCILFGTLKTDTMQIDTANFDIAISNPLAVTENTIYAGNLYPNPTNGNVSINLNAKSASSVNILIYNLLGQPVYNQTVATYVGNQIVSLPIENLPQGIYTLVLQDKKGGAAITRKVVKY